MHMRFHIIKDKLNKKQNLCLFLCAAKQKKKQDEKIKSKRNNGYYYHKQANRTNPSNPIHVHVQYFKMICKRFLNANYFALAHLAPVIHTYRPCNKRNYARNCTTIICRRTVAQQMKRPEISDFKGVYLSSCCACVFLNNKINIADR